jgi:2-polyprenyl-3-methyl-5-hydroxy-6-metoxy-1,4-benzoquinol methylase
VSCASNAATRSSIRKGNDSADIFQSLCKGARESVQKIADRLEYRGAYPRFFFEMRERFFNWLRPDQCCKVLGVGRGAGLATRALAARLPADATLTGSSFSDDLIEFARYYAAAEGLQDRLSFEFFDSHGTEETKAKFDLVVLHMLISHGADPSQVLKEAGRVTEPDGRIAVFNGDCASITFGAGNLALNNLALQGLLKTVVAHLRIMRQFPEFVAGSGLDIVEVLAGAEKADLFKSILNSCT